MWVSWFMVRLACFFALVLNADGDSAALPLFDYIERDFLFLLAGDGAPHALDTVGVDAKVPLRARFADVPLAIVDQFDVPAAVDVDDRLVHRGPLAGVAGDAIGQIDFPSVS